ncbi:hypothetical protein PAMP_017301 [Pampus punctatissimus]
MLLSDKVTQPIFACVRRGEPGAVISGTCRQEKGKIPGTLVVSDESSALNRTTCSLFPPLTQDETAVNDPVPSVAHNLHYNSPKTSSLPHNMPQYRNMFNDRAKRGFCYWLVEKKASTCKGYSFGAYKTSLGLPKV